MSNYRRAQAPGGTFFFTLVTHQRRDIFGCEDNIAVLRDAFHQVKKRQAFHLDAIVVMPDHLHCILRLPGEDSDYSGRWREIKKLTSKQINHQSNQSRERNIWQRRFWEHLIRNEDDWRKHIDYIHYNPVKHGLVARPVDWPWSSFRKCVALGWYDQSWGSSPPDNITGMDHE